MPTPTPYLNDAVYQMKPSTRQLWAGALLTDWLSYTMLYAETSNMATALYSAFRRFGGSADYQVPAGKNLYVKALVITIASGGSLDTTSSDNHLGFGDTGIGFNAGALPTNPFKVDVGGATGANNNTNTEVVYAQALNARIPGGKYPYISNGPIFPAQNGFPVRSILIGKVI